MEQTPPVARTLPLALVPCEEVARSRPPKDRPWYHVLVDGSGHPTYVAERHLEASADRTQVENPLLGEHFESYDGRRYHPRNVH